MRVCSASIPNSGTDLTKLAFEPGLTVDLQDHRGTSPLRVLARVRPSSVRIDSQSGEVSWPPSATVKPNGGPRSTLAVLSYELNAKELLAINDDFECSLLNGLRFNVEYKADTSGVGTLDIDERPFLDLVAGRADLAIASVDTSLCTSVAELLRDVRAHDPDGVTGIHRFLHARFIEPEWKNLVSERVFRVHIWSNLPQFAYASYLPAIPGVDLGTLGQASRSGPDPVNEQLLAEVLHVAGCSLPELGASSKVPAFWNDFGTHLSRELTDFVGGMLDLTVAFSPASDRADHARLHIIETEKHGTPILKDSATEQLLSLMLFSRAAIGVESEPTVLLLDGVDQHIPQTGHAALVTALQRIASRHQVVFMPHNAASWREAYATP